MLQQIYRVEVLTVAAIALLLFLAVNRVTDFQGSVIYLVSGILVLLFVRRLS